MSETVRHVAAVLSAALPEIQRIQSEIDRRRELQVQADKAAFVAAYETEAMKPAVTLSGAAANESALRAESFVSSEQLANFAGVTEKCIRKILFDSPHKTDNHGRKLFDYAFALPVLQNWCETSRTRRLNSIRWPNLPENLKTLRPERKKK